MLNVDPILPHVPAFAVVLARVGGIFMFTTMLSSGTIPNRVKVMMALVFALALYPVVGTEQLTGMRVELWSLLPLMAGEIMVGASIGMLASIPLLSLQMSGLIMGQQMGLGIASLIDPNSDISGDVLGQLLFIAGIAMFIALGGFEVIFDCLVVSFTLLPPGFAGAEAAPLEVLTGLVASGFEMALRISMPVLTIIFVESFAGAFLMKTIPSLNIMNFGFPIRILIGMAAFAASLTIIAELMRFEISAALGVTTDWVWSHG